MTPANRRVGPPQVAFEGEAPDALAPASAPPKPVVPIRSRWLAGLGTALGVAAAAAASAGVAWASHHHVTTSPRFAVTAIEVAGNERRAAGAIVAESGLAPGANVFSVDLDAARRAVLSDPWIAEAALSRKLPGTISIRVTERRAAALVSLDDVFVAGPDGEPFKKFELSDPVDVPFITGLRPDRAHDDDGRLAIRRGIELASEYQQSALSRRAPLEEVHVDDDGSFALVVDEASVELFLGRPPFRRKLDEAARVVAELDRRKAKARAILLDNSGRPERVVVRLRQ